MLEELGVVVKATEQYAWVKTQRKASCGHCESKSSCGTASLAQVLGQKYTEVRVENNLAVKEGDTVIIGLAEQALVTTSLTAYLIPLITLFLTAVSYESIAPFIGLPTTEIFTILAGFAGLGLGFIVVKYLSNYLSLHAQYQPVLLRIQMR
ncbi:SoxR reducing system RseC family protein [Candidatus Albibeggiatoa sp. nov. NOAA]|uniref:SoxR reducing system RseC family protein n=1 Tax=Candidatus Albibeggiatoa sp. nov. NOAA TaxID=3162724 RepID=UPI0032F761A1|nr:SoxR reducing system RseC family protein [Thiotrichaceae bacterium]